MVHVQVRVPPTRKFECLCALRKILCCNYPDQAAALDAMVADGYWDSLPKGNEVVFVKGECQHLGGKKRA